jgi:aryl-alcohol dehydrogenase-like predicted oxidoreductase
MSCAVHARTWHLEEAESRPFIKRALEHSINFFDVANMYSKGESEMVLGRALKGYARREEVVIATKVYFPMRPGPNGGGLSRAEVALAWLLSKPVVTAPIVGATKPEHLEDAVAALGVKLTDEEIAALEAPYVPHPVAGVL